MPTWFIEDEAEPLPSSVKDWQFSGTTLPPDWTLTRAGPAMGRDAAGRWIDYPANAVRPHRIPVTEATESAYSLGTAAGGSTLSGGIVASGGNISRRFVATSAATFLQIQRQAAGTVAVSDIVFKPSPTPTWTAGGPGTVSVAGNGAVTLTGTGGAATTATQTFATIPGRQYTISLSASSAVGYTVSDA